MKTVRRDEIVDYQTYDERRHEIRARVFETKKVRRIHVGDALTFLFENAETVRYQVQEMMRAERIVKEADIRHELDTYNEILGGPGELGCTLLVEITDEAIRREKLVLWRDLPETLRVRLEDGSTVAATFDERQRAEEKLSSVQFLKFDTKGATPVAIECTHPDVDVTAELSEAQRAALASDLSSG